MAAAAPPAPTPPPHDPATFRRLYPEEFLSRHLAAHTRPCGRSLTEARPLTISLEGGGGVASPSSSQATTALVRAGRTAALAGLRLEVAPAPPTGAAAADGGILVVTVEIPPISSGERREGGRLVGLAGAVRAGLERCVDLAALRIPSSAPPSPSPAAAIFVARLDIVLLSADGGELGVALAAGAAALAATAVPGVAVKGGRVVRVAPGPAAEPGAALNAAAAAATAAPPGAAGASRIAGLLTALPVAMSAGLWTGGRAVVVVDPDAEEEGLVDGLVSVVVGMMAAAHPPRPAGGVMPAASPPSMPPLLHAVFSGGPALAPPGLVVSTAGAARARGEEVRRVLVAALEQRG